jgi:hypothetical protein
MISRLPVLQEFSAQFKNFENRSDDVDRDGGLLEFIDGRDRPANLYPTPRRNVNGGHQTAN